MKVAILITLMCNVILSYAKRDGAPKEACSSLMPQHNNIEAQKSSSPYTITAVKSGNKVRVKISSPSGEEFKGFILQARSSNDPSKLIDGEFTSSDVAKATVCFDGAANTLTHINPEPKKEVTTEWTPKNVDEAIIFRATVAKEWDKFWTEVDSMPVSEEDSDMYYDCFSKKGCFGMPADCVKSKSCKVLSTWSVSSNNVLFELHGYLDPSTYMAMALSYDAYMGDDSVTECIRDEHDVIVRESWNEGKKSTRTKELPKGSYKSSFTDGLTSCSWSRPKVTDINSKTYDFIKETYHILVAEGEVSNKTLLYHYSNKEYTAVAINFTAFDSVKDESSTVKVQGDVITTEFHNQPSDKHDDMPTDSTTNKIAPSKASEADHSGSGSLQFSFSLFLLTILWLFYTTEGKLFGCFGLF